MNEVRPRPYGTVVIDFDGEVVMLVGIVSDTDEQVGYQLDAGGATPLHIRRIWDALIDRTDEEGLHRYRVQAS